MLIFGAAITIYVHGYMIYFAIVFRRRADEPINTVGIPIHDAPKLELWWTILPTMLLVVLMYFTIVVWKQIQFPETAATLTMEVVAHQFNFEFRYPGLQGRAVLAGERDASPGRQAGQDPRVVGATSSTSSGCPDSASRSPRSRAW